MNYVAFLHGINVGSHKVPMRDLKKSFESLGLTDVKTLLNSGNVVFSSRDTDILRLTKIIEETLSNTFGFEIPIIIRLQTKIRALVRENPFKNIPVTPETRLYVTFLSEKKANNLKIPYKSQEKDFRILQVSQSEICSVVILTQKTGTLDLMNFLEKKFGSPRGEVGKYVTTRNWNTIKKLADL
jgi:uncharacterized protein (DUF1697 family)